MRRGGRVGFSQARRYESLLVCRARPLLASHAGNGAPSAHAMPALQNRRCHLRCSPSEQVELEVTASLVLASHVASFPRPSVRACRPRALNARAHCARPLRTPIAHADTRRPRYRGDPYTLQTPSVPCAVRTVGDSLARMCHASRWIPAVGVSKTPNLGCATIV